MPPKTYDVVGIAHNADIYCPDCAKEMGVYESGGAVFRDTELDTQYYCGRGCACLNAGHHSPEYDGVVGYPIDAVILDVR